jgi:hypothetical protein
MHELLRFLANWSATVVSHLTTPLNIGLVVVGVLLWRELRKGKRPV